VKNKSTKEILEGVTMEQRAVNEKNFFQTAPWNQLPKDRVGIAPLKRFLGKLLYNHIRGEFPGLVQELRSSVMECRNELEALGPPRRTSMEQRQFLMRLAAKYQRTVADSLSGNYDSALEAHHPLKLRMHIQIQNEAFGSSIEHNGHTRPFRLVDGTVDESFKRDASDKRAKAEGSIYDWIRELYRESRGAELPGTVNPAVLERLFRQQSAQWDPIAQKHSSKVEEIIRGFNQTLLEEIVPDESLRARMEERILRFQNAAHIAAANQLEQILQDERGGILQTINHYFADTLSKTREDRVLARLKGLGLRDGDHQQVNLKAIANAAHLSNEDQAVNDIHDILKSYYQVAMKRFMDNVVLQVVERIYLGDDGPVKAVSPEYVGTLSETDLSDIAAESYATSSARMDIGYRLERLEKALNLAESQAI
jgi:hypothetical protein